MSKVIQNREEILFLYEAKDCNPNGDPLDENRPRTDSETGVITVTDVRIKRTVRDFILNLETDKEVRLKSGREILIRDTFKEDGYLAQGQDRAKDFYNNAYSKAKNDQKKLAALGEEVLKKCIDARLFGATLPLGKGDVGLKLTGPVQFSAFNRSLHQVSPLLIQQTAAYAGSAKAGQKSFAERWLVPYALIAAYGVINEMAAKTTGLNDADVALLVEALWQGTASLNTHSKMGHLPLLLLRIQYLPGYRLGALPERIRLVNAKTEEIAIRSTSDYEVDVNDLLKNLVEIKDKIAEINVIQDKRIKLVAGDKHGDFVTLAGEHGLKATTLSS
ncbi:MAG: type I-B CRISPR-associated protein Cas7/Csh2 [Thermoleophilia bacterium]|nr:type I-B CRISPR-associated protein Cas7/Csh2 [Thermoleophilia bacterium]